MMVKKLIIEISISISVNMIRTKMNLKIKNPKSNECNYFYKEISSLNKNSTRSQNLKLFEKTI